MQVLPRLRVVLAPPKAEIFELGDDSVKGKNDPAEDSVCVVIQQPGYRAATRQTADRLPRHVNRRRASLPPRPRCLRMPTLSHFGFPHQMPCSRSCRRDVSRSVRMPKQNSQPPFRCGSQPNKDSSPSRSRSSASPGLPVPGLVRARTQARLLSCRVLSLDIHPTLDHCRAAPTKVRASGVSPPPHSGQETCRPNFEYLGIPPHSTTHPTHIRSCGVPACLRERGGPEPPSGPPRT